MHHLVATVIAREFGKKMPIRKNTFVKQISQKARMKDGLVNIEK